MIRLPASTLSLVLGALLALATSAIAADGRAASAVQRPSPQDLANAANNPNTTVAQTQAQLEEARYFRDNT